MGWHFLRVVDERTTSSVANQNAGFALVHWLGDTNLGYMSVRIPYELMETDCAIPLEN